MKSCIPKDGYWWLDPGRDRQEEKFSEFEYLDTFVTRFAAHHHRRWARCPPCPVLFFVSLILPWDIDSSPVLPAIHAAAQAQVRVTCLPFGTKINTFISMAKTHTSIFQSTSVSFWTPVHQSSGVKAGSVCALITAATQSQKRHKSKYSWLNMLWAEYVGTIPGTRRTMIYWCW